MGSCCSSTADNNPPPHAASRSEASQSQLQPTLSTSQVGAAASLQYSAEILASSIPEALDDRRSERGSIRSRRSSRSQRSVRSQPAPDMYQRPRSQSAQGASRRPEWPPTASVPVPPLVPPAVRPRAVTEATRTHRARGSRNENLPVDLPPTPQLPRQNRKSAPGDSSRRWLTSTVWSTLSDDFRFRILVVGKSGSGKSSVINSIFKVDAASIPRTTDINIGIPYSDNSRLIVHEWPGFEPGYNLQVIRDFITVRTDARVQPSERLHAIWICVPVSDLINRNLGDGVQDILAMRQAPAVLVFTKFDIVFSQVLFDISGGNSQHTQYHEPAKVRVQEMYEESCRHLLGQQPRDIPAEMVSTKPRFGDLISELFSTTNKLVAAVPLSATVPSTSFEAHRGGPHISPVSLAWSIAQRISRDVNLQTSIIVGRSRYWRNLGSSREFSGRTMEYCIDAIHNDVVDVWNLRDHNKYLTTREFKSQMSHLVKDLSRPPGGPSRSNLDGVGLTTPAAQWVKDTYENSIENICCIMGYIVDLTVILHGLFRSGRDVSAPEVRILMEHHDKTTRSQVHNDVRRFSTGTPTFTYRGNDLILEKTIDLMARFCPAGNS